MIVEKLQLIATNFVYFAINDVGLIFSY
jgi:hypothetical protein